MLFSLCPLQKNKKKKKKETKNTRSGAKRSLSGGNPSAPAILIVYLAVLTAQLTQSHGLDLWYSPCTNVHLTISNFRYPEIFFPSFSRLFLGILNIFSLIFLETKQGKHKMAVSAFKSPTSRRSNLTTTTSSSSSRTNNNNNNKALEREITEKKVPPRRSRSVSALSRTQTHLDVASEFLNKRDNPLFRSSGSGGDGGSPPSDAAADDNIETIKSAAAVKTAKIDEIRSSAGETRRGRSVSRNGDDGKVSSGNRKEIGRSLSRVDTGRRGRSMSVRPVSRHHSEVWNLICLWYGNEFL